MARVIVAPAAVADLDTLILALDLPSDTRSRVRARLRQLAEFPASGEELGGRWECFRYVLGPWRWMLLLYVFDGSTDQVSVVTIQDSRSARPATSHR